MKTLDEVIKGFECCNSINCAECPYANWDNTDVVRCNDTEKEDDALHYLKELRHILDNTVWVNSTKEKTGYWKLPTLPETGNDPLSWEQLKQMEGKPVWVEVQDDNGDHYKWRGDRWYIVKDFSQGYYGGYCHLEPNYRTWTEQTYGELWQAYRKERS